MIFTGITLISKKFNALDTKAHFFDELTLIYLNYTYFTESRYKNVIFTGIILIQTKIIEFDTEKQFFGYFTKIHQETALWCPIR